MGVWSKVRGRFFPKKSDSNTYKEAFSDSLEEPRSFSTKGVMTQIYSEKKWGGAKYDFYSGFGSHSNTLVKPYVKAVSDFFFLHNNALVVCDVGCGDFNVGSRLVKFTGKYLAIDVVDSLIERNKALFKDERLTFLCLNLVEDPLPKGDCILVRQVLQHLSNEAILKALEKFREYRFLIVTEHLPKKDFVPNLDKEIGANTRLSKNSGVVLHAPPFNLAYKRKKEWLKIRCNKGVVVTTLYEF